MVVRWMTSANSVIQMEVLAAGGYSGIGFGLHSEIVAPYLLHYGTDAQKENTCQSSPAVS